MDISRQGRLALCRRVACLLLPAAALLGFAAEAAAAPRTDIVLGMSVEPAGLDPTAGAPVAAGQVTWQNIFEGLTRIDEKGRIRPQLAQSWDIDGDGLTYRFTLADGVLFHNGAPFDSATAKFAIDRILSKESTNPQKALFSAISRVETPDATHLVLRLSRPAGELLFWLGTPAAVMVEPGSADTNRTQPVGTGPFRFVEWRKGDSVAMERFSDYWNPDGAAKLDRARIRFIADPQAQNAALLSKGVDAFAEFGAPELFRALSANPRFVTHAGNTEMKVVAGMNNARKPFDDPRVRRALMMAVSRPLLIDSVSSGYGTPIGSHFSPNDPGYVDLANAIPYDPKAAKALLAEAGYPNGFSFVLKAPSRAYASRTAEVLQAFLAEIGVKARIESSEFPAAWVQNVFKDQDYDMTVIGHAEPLDIGIYARKPYYFNYNNPAFDAKLAELERTTDEAARAALYGDLQRILAQDVPALFLFVQPKLGVWDAKLAGLWENEPVPSNDLTEVYWRD